MEEVVHPARRITGQVRVPGERDLAERTLLFSALAEGESCLTHAPPSIGGLVEILEKLGAEIRGNGDEIRIRGKGLHGLHPVKDVLDVEDLGEGAVLLGALLASQTFESRIRPGGKSQTLRALLDLLVLMGANCRWESDDLVLVGGKKIRGFSFEAADVPPDFRLPLLLAGLCAEGTTRFEERSGGKDRPERILRERGIAVERRRKKEKTYQISIEGGQTLHAARVELPGDLNLAYPWMVPALLCRRSELRIPNVALRPGRRGLLDLLRQIGGKIEIQERKDGIVDLAVSSSTLKPTRVAGQRAEKVIDQVALLAVLATQLQGETVIRDIERLREGRFDYVDYLADLLRRIGARVGEFPEGIVIKGVSPLRGARIDPRGDPGLAMAFSIAGLLSEGEMAIEDGKCLESVYPGFFSALRSLKEQGR